MLSHSGFIIDDFANPGGLCSLIHFFDKGAVDVKRIQDFYSAHGSKLIVIFAEGSVKYYSLHNEKEMETRFPVLETFLQGLSARSSFTKTTGDSAPVGQILQNLPSGSRRVGRDRRWRQGNEAPKSSMCRSFHGKPS
jgi:hypothetical protein